MVTISKNTNNKLNLLRNVSFAEVAYEQIREMIFSGNISPGGRINEKQIAETLEISRAPIREAVRQLQKEGLIDITKNKGAFIKNISPEEAMELYEVRAALEVLAVEKAAENAGESDLSLLEQCVNELQKAAESENEKAHYDAAVLFHQIIFNISRNRSLIEMITSVSSKIVLFRRKLVDYMDNNLPCADEEAILLALKHKDGKKAAEIMQKHVLRGRDRIVDNLIQNDQ